ncbi:hypothetical protein ACHAXS_012915 [Conticribra weissflogii]
MLDLKETSSNTAMKMPLAMETYQNRQIHPSTTFVPPPLDHGICHSHHPKLVNTHQGGFGRYFACLQEEGRGKRGGGEALSPTFLQLVQRILWCMQQMHNGRRDEGNDAREEEMNFGMEDGISSGRFWDVGIL